MAAQVSSQEVSIPRAIRGLFLVGVDVWFLLEGIHVRVVDSGDNRKQEQGEGPSLALVNLCSRRASMVLGNERNGVREW